MNSNIQLGVGKVRGGFEGRLRAWLAGVAVLWVSLGAEAQIQRITVDSDAKSAVVDGVSIYSVGNEIHRTADGSLWVSYARNHPMDVVKSPNYIYLARSSDNGAHWTYQRTDGFSRLGRPDFLMGLPTGGFLLGTTFNGQGYVNRSDTGNTWLPMADASTVGRLFPLDSTQTSSGVVMDVDASGTLHMAYTRSFDSDTRPYNIGYRTSKDHGATWSAETDLTQFPNDFTNVGYGAWYPSLVAGPAGSVYVAYSRWFKTNIVVGSVTNVVHYNVPQLSVFDGTKWLAPQIFGDASIGRFAYPILSLDNAGNLHAVHIQRPGASAAGRVIYRKWPRGASAMTDPILISPDTQDALNLSMGVFEADTVVVAWDVLTTVAGSLVYNGVHVVSSADGFQQSIEVSTPGKAGRSPNVRSRAGVFNAPNKMDILWVEDDPASTADAHIDRLVLADVGPVIPRPVVLTVVPSGTGVTVRFTGVGGRSYQLVSAPSLTAAWTAFGSPVVSTGAISSVEVPTGATAGFFRINDVTP